MQENTSDTKNIQVLNLSEDLDTQALAERLIEEKGAVRYRDAYYLKYPHGEAWLFDYGVLVTWNLTPDERRELYLELHNLADAEHSDTMRDQYRYQVDHSLPFKIQHDLIVLNSDDLLPRLALSHAFAQSNKLQLFEEHAQQVIQDNRFLTKELAANGKISLTRRQLAKLRGALFDTSSDISLHFNLLDTPEFFWDYPEVEPYYEALAKYLDLKPRIDILNHKLSTIHELLDMLAAEQHHKHSSFLEWIIIILIAVDIVVYFSPH